MTCKHGFDWRQYGTCPMCEDEHQAREQDAYNNRPSKESALIVGAICWAGFFVLLVVGAVVGSMK